MERLSGNSVWERWLLGETVTPERVSVWEWQLLGESVTWRGCLVILCGSGMCMSSV